MPHLNLDLDYFTHPKIMRLAGMLGPYALALPIRLWCHTAKHHCETGKLEGYTKYEVESVAGWTGQPGDFVDALVKIRLLDEIENGYAIHDWLEHAGHFKVYKKRAKSAAKKRWNRYASSIAKPRVKQCPGPVRSGPVLQGNKEEEEKKPARSRKLTDEEFLESLKANPAYAHIDLPTELGKMDGWLLTHPGRQKTRKFIVNWLNKIEKPLQVVPGVKHEAPIPPKPPKTDPIGRGLWDRAYGHLVDKVKSL